MRYAFGGFELDTEARTLERSGRGIPVQARVFDLLAYLIERRERVVPNYELLSALWADVSVGPGALSRAVQKARQVVDDDGEQQAVLRTEHGRGLRFVAEVSLVSDAPTPTADPRAARRWTPRCLPRHRCRRKTRRDALARKAAACQRSTSGPTIRAAAGRRLNSTNTACIRNCVGNIKTPCTTRWAKRA